ncbi:hypothetical protein EDF72_2980 [Delftia acidovorans]|nr:hypothetical protein EDF72_2980 [Delftia acidovorans]
MLVALFFYGVLSLPLPGGCFSRPGFGPAADLLSYRATRKRGKEARPKLPTTLRFAAGDLRWAGCGVCRRTRCALARFAQTTAASQMTKQPCPSAGLPPRIPPNAGVGRRGEAGAANSQQPTAGAIAPLGFKPGPSEAKARTTSPYVSACGVVVSGLQSCRRTGLLRQLTRCGCLSGARSAKRVPQRTPQPPRRRLPRSEAQGSRAFGRVSLPTFLSRDKKVGRPPGRTPASRNNPPAGTKKHP